MLFSSLFTIVLILFTMVLIYGSPLYSPGPARLYHLCPYCEGSDRKNQPGRDRRVHQRGAQQRNELHLDQAGHENHLEFAPERGCECRATLHTAFAYYYEERHTTVLGYEACGHRGI